MLSIIVPVYNSEKYLLRCLNSINNQTLDNIEVILVDDGSTDSSSEIIDSYIFKNATKITIHSENNGLLSAWKKGVAASHGEYIGFVDSDDYIEKDMYSEMIRKAKAYNVDMVVCGIYHENKNNKISITNQPIKEGLYKGSAYQTVLNNIVPTLNKDYISPSRVNKIVKKPIVEESMHALSNDVTSGEDNYSTFRWFLFSKSVYILNVPYYHYCFNNASMSYVYKPKILDAYSTLITDSINFNTEKGEPVDKKKLINLYNFYGFVWCKYVYNSSLDKKVKKAEIKRLNKIKGFKKAIRYSEKGHFIRKILYKLTIVTNNPFFIMLGIKFMNKKNKN